MTTPYDWLAKTYTNYYSHMTKIATRPAYGKNSLNLFFSGNKKAIGFGTCLIHDDVPTDWEQRCIILLYTGKCDALDRGNFRAEQVNNILKTSIDDQIRLMTSLTQEEALQMQSVWSSNCRKST